MIATQIIAGIVTLFVILDPLGVLPFFLSLTRGSTVEQRRNIANKAVLITICLLLIFAFLGDAILLFLSIQISDFEIAGWVLLLLFALRDALSIEPFGFKETTAALDTTNMLETIAVIPIATPLLAGPGSLTTVMLLTRQPYGLLVGAAAIMVDCSIAWLLLRVSGRINKFVGPSGLMIIGKVMDILMAAIAVSFLTSGITSLLAG
ncbi:MAG: MarC family protein [Nitrososphaerota archaeon]|nr:MarC family protein [Nitrososphaerota archaeon]